MSNNDLFVSTYLVHDCINTYERVIFLCRVGIAYHCDSWWAMPTLRNQFDTDLRNSVLSFSFDTNSLRPCKPIYPPCSEERWRGVRLLGTSLQKNSISIYNSSSS